MIMFVTAAAITAFVFLSGYLTAAIMHDEDRCSEIYAQGFHDGYGKCIDDINNGRGII